MRPARLPIAVLLLLAACACSSSPTGIVNLRAPLPGVWTSGQPTEAQFDALPEMGITRVIQLRLANEKGTGWEEERAPAAGLDFVRIPVDGQQGLTRENVDRLAAELDRTTESGVLVCCGSSNRVGALLALKARWIDGASPEQALELGKAAGMTRLEPAVQTLLK